MNWANFVLFETKFEPHLSCFSNLVTIGYTRDDVFNFETSPRKYAMHIYYINYKLISIYNTGKFSNLIQIFNKHKLTEHNHDKQSFRHTKVIDFKAWSRSVSKAINIESDFLSFCKNTLLSLKILHLTSKTLKPILTQK